MLPEQWQSIDRLLLCCVDVVLTGALVPALQLLYQALPETEITLLVSAAGDALTDFSTLQRSDIQVMPVRPWTDRKQIQWLRQQCFDAAIIFTESFRSPYAMAYLCYLAGIPIRVAQSQEFGGAVLSACVPPPPEPVSPEAYHLHLLQVSGLLHLQQSHPPVKS